MMLLLGHAGQGIGAVRLGGRHPGGPPGRPPARGRLRPRRRGLPGLREADDGNDHRDRPLAQDDRDGHAEEPRARRRGQGCARGRRAGGRGPRRSPLRQGLRLQRRSLLAAAGDGARCRPRAPHQGWGRLPLLGRAPLRAGASPGPWERAGRPATRGRVLRRQDAGRGPAPSDRPLRPLLRARRRSRSRAARARGTRSRTRRGPS